MDEINQVPVTQTQIPQTPVTPTPNLPLPEITPPGRKNVKIWVGIIAVIAVVSVGAFLMFGKTSIYKGSFEKFGSGAKKADTEKIPLGPYEAEKAGGTKPKDIETFEPGAQKFDSKETPKAEIESPFGPSKAEETAAEEKAKELNTATTTKFADAQNYINESETIAADISTAVTQKKLDEADKLYKKLEINDAAIFNAKSTIGEFRKQITSLFNQYTQNIIIQNSLKEATTLYNLTIDFADQSAKILKNAKNKIDSAKALKAINDALAGIGDQTQDQLAAAAEEAAKAAADAIAMVDEMNQLIADAEKAAANAKKYAEEAVAATDSVKDLQNSTYPEVAEKAKAANNAAGKALGAMILADSAVVKAKKAKTLADAQAAKTQAEKAETDAKAAMEDAKAFAQQAKDLLAGIGQIAPLADMDKAIADAQKAAADSSAWMNEINALMANVLSLPSDVQNAAKAKAAEASGANTVVQDSFNQVKALKPQVQNATSIENKKGLVIEAQTLAIVAQHNSDIVKAALDAIKAIFAITYTNANNSGDIKCETGFLYDTNTKTCVPPSNITCASGLLYDPNSKACVPQSQIIQNVLGGGGSSSSSSSSSGGGGSTNVTVNIPPLMSPSAPDVKCSDPKFTYDAVAKVCVPPTQVAIADKDKGAKKDTKKTQKKSAKSAADDKKETVIAADTGSQPKIIDAAPKPAAATAYGATIQGKTGPEILLYFIAIGAVNAGWWIRKKIRK